MSLLSPLWIGDLALRNNVLLAPMAGVTDLPFRRACWQHGAGLTVSEMVAANPAVRSTRKSQLRLQPVSREAPLAVQIVGSEPQSLADAARYHAQQGVDLIDINMGCPARKVCRKAAGSALLGNEILVAEILTAVVRAVELPVTLKIRTGLTATQKNAPRIARIAEEAGIKMLTVHGRTRDARFRGAAEYDTIAGISAATQIPVIANGDIDGPDKANEVLQETGAQGVMIGRAALGRPWIFREITHFLATGERLKGPTSRQLADQLLTHLEALYAFYGTRQGLRIARKHIAWYLQDQPTFPSFKQAINRADDHSVQCRLVKSVLAT